MSTKNVGCVSGSRCSSKTDAKDCQDNEDDEQVSHPLGSISSTIQNLKKQVLADRISYVKEKVELNRKNIELYMDKLLSLSKSRKVINQTGKDETKDIFTCRIEKAPCKFSLDLTSGDKENLNCQEEGSNASSIFGSNCGGKNGVRSYKLPEVQQIPPYTTWIFLDRNQRMTEDQSVLGRRRIYYDPNGNEALICSDSEEEMADDEEEKPDFSEGDDHLLLMTIQEHGLSEAVFENLTQVLEVKPREIQARYDYLIEQDRQRQLNELEDNGPGVDNVVSDCIFLGKDLDAAMDSFENLFCRRCLVFDCRLHGCSQDLVYPCEKQPPWIPPEEDSSMPCGIHCYKLAPQVEESSSVKLLSDGAEAKPSVSTNKDGIKVCSRKKVSSAAGTKTPKTINTESSYLDEKLIGESSREIILGKDDSDFKNSESPKKGKRGRKMVGSSKKNNKRAAERVLVCMRKRQKRLSLDTSSTASEGVSPTGSNLRSSSRKGVAKPSKALQKTTRDSTRKKSSRKKYPTIKSESKSEVMMLEDGTETAGHAILAKIEEEGVSLKKRGTIMAVVKQADGGWSALEKGLYAKGVEIFGRNSCLIARNVLNGLKTCAEVADYIRCNESSMQRLAGDGLVSWSDGTGKVDCGDAIGTEVRTRTRFWRRRGRVRRLKYTWKSAGHPSIRKRIADSKDQPCKQYTPCNCQSACGKQCPCLESGTCCEKYCGCSKGCKNRFRGCHCAKSQCRSRQCPCFAAGRECDPDVCRNCWVGCGDGTLGGPPPRGDNYECRNMKLLLKQQQRVLLGRSDVSGWGAFLKNSVNKHDYLGEYTGELISHREADKRGKIYDRENSSFLFNLNDQYVLDAYRKGDKLKFANHSPTPNCYAKVIMVAGDHRVGIFAKERIQGGEELFYDYRYEPDRAPVWARKPEGSISKRDETSTSHGRAKKLA